MYIKPFEVEEWMNKYETGAKYNIAETCADSISVDELFEMTGEDKEEFFKNFCAKRLTYGAIEGNPKLKEGICSLYHTIKPENIVTTHGASGANHHIFYSIISPGDRVISIMPAYQQLYSIPESYGANLKIINLKSENNYLPDLDELKSLAVQGTKLICINNPNNPTGALMDKTLLMDIIDIAKSVDAYVLCDEVYRHLTQEDGWCESIVDLYEKGISVSSMSKVFSMAGVRLGWIVTHDMAVVKSCFSHRDYNLVSCGMFDEALSAVALRHSDVILDRNRTLVRKNLYILDNWINSEKHFSYIKPMAGTTALVYYDFDIPSYEFCKQLYYKTGAFVTPGDCFKQPKSIRIGYACNEQVLIDGLKVISQFVNDIA